MSFYLCCKCKAELETKWNGALHFAFGTRYMLMPSREKLTNLWGALRELKHCERVSASWPNFKLTGKNTWHLSQCPILESLSPFLPSHSARVSRSCFFITRSRAASCWTCFPWSSVISFIFPFLKEVLPIGLILVTINFLPLMHIAIRSLFRTARRLINQRTVRLTSYLCILIPSSSDDSNGREFARQSHLHWIWMNMVQ